MPIKKEIIANEILKRDCRNIKHFDVAKRRCKNFHLPNNYF